MIDIVGIDLSLTSTGISLSNCQVAVSSKYRGIERIADLTDQIFNVMTNAFPVDTVAVVVEGYSFASRSSHAHSAGELGGVFRYRLWLQGIPWIDVPPTNRAKFATGRGGASKTEVVSSVSARTGLVWSGKGADDMCDAFILEEMGKTVLGKGQFSWPAKNLEALDKIDWSVISQLENAKES